MKGDCSHDTARTYRCYSYCCTKKREQQVQQIKKDEDEYNAALEAVLALRPRVSELIELANQVLESGLEFPKEGTCYRKFFSDGIRHKIGFMGNGIQPISYIGIYNGGACGPWDFYIDGAICFARHGKTKEVGKPNIHMLNKFQNGFPVFESEFLAWIDSFASNT